MTEDLLKALEGKWDTSTRPAALYETRIRSRPADYVETILAGLASKNRRVQGGAAELASLLSAEHPELLYPHVGLFLENLRAKQPIVRWEAVCTVGNLARADEQKLIGKHVAEMVELLADKSIVLQGHAVGALAKVAEQNPKLAPEIFEALIKAARFFPGSRVGYVVEAMATLGRQQALVSRVRKFLAKHLASEHAPVARKAKKALKLLEARGSDEVN